MLETGRLRLRPQRVPDAVVQRELWSERDPRVPAHRRLSPDGRPTLAELQERIRTGDRGRSLGLLAVELIETGEVIGSCGLIATRYGDADEPEIAFELLRRSWGAGYATEAAGAVLGWADAAGAPRVWASVRDWNTASRRVLQKLGFEETTRLDRDEAHGDVIVAVRRRPDGDASPSRSPEGAPTVGA